MMRSSAEVVQSIRDLEHLEDLLSTPTEGVVATLGRLTGDVIILGVAGKMGPSLARMVRRGSELAGVERRVIGVSRFSSGGLAGLETSLNAAGVETIRCDLLDPQQLERLPDAPTVIYMAGMKFGSTGNEALTWAMNSYLPGMVSQKFRRSRIVAFSTGNVYGLVPLSSGGSREGDALNPEGDYAMSCVGRERIFEHFSRRLGVPMAMIRLNYAVEMRYGVIVDLARRILSGEPVDVTMSAVNLIWQADASAMAIQSLDHASTPPFVINVTGPETLSVRRLGQQLAELLQRPIAFSGIESDSALLNNAQLAHRLFGYPRVPVERVAEWTADWLSRGGTLLEKPTHFEARDGRF